MISLELLAPAKNLECGIAAIDHGADAVYIGAGKFGARAAATNSTGDIRSLCQYAHRFGARVYVTVNTIVYDHELEDARRLVGELCDAGADALLVQDMALVDIVAEEASRRGVALSLHASTQTDNRTAEKVEWLAAMGFRRVVLARELSLDEIADIHHKVPGMQLEAFVHGALCVSYSGQCYASQYCFGRSANRGECAQFCRLSFDLVDANGAAIDLSGRKTIFGDNHENKPVLTADEAAEYGDMSKMFGDWQPTLLTEQAPIPTDLQVNGAELSWTGSDYALLYAIVKDGNVVAFTTETAYTATEKGTYAVRAANEMGGLSAPSAAVTISNATGIQTVESHRSTSTMEAVYSLDGKRLQHMQRGLNIVKMSDGRMVKMINK